MSTLKTHNLQSPDSGSANIALAPNAGMVVAGISTFSNNIIANTKIGIGTNNPSTILHLRDDSNDCDLTVQATASGKDARINLYGHSGGVSQIRLGDEADGNVGLITYDHSNNSMQLRAGDSERLRIDANGKVIIGTEFVNAGNANAAISLFLSGNRSGAYGGVTTNAIIFDNQTAAVDAGGTLTLAGYSGTQAVAKALIRGGNEGSSSTQAGYFSVFVRPSSGILTERLRIDSAGNLSLGKGAASSTQYGRNFQIHDTGTSGSTLHLTQAATGSSNGDGFHLVFQTGHIYHWLRESGDQVFATGGTEKLRIASTGNVSITDGNLILASGHGIDFSATANGTGTNQNELLDDYEEGDWQPKVSAGGANWSTTGRYTKVGRIVTIQADITNTSGSGTTEIHNLPFTVDSKYGTWHVGYAAVNGTTTSGNTSYTGGLVHFQGNGYLRARASGGTTNITMGNNHRTIFTGTYYTT